MVSQVTINVKRHRAIVTAGENGHLVYPRLSYGGVLGVVPTGKP